MRGFPGGLVMKDLLANAGDAGLIPWRSKRQLQCSCLGNLMDRGAWQTSPWGCKRVRHDLETKTATNNSCKVVPHCSFHLPFPNI